MSIKAIYCLAKNYGWENNAKYGFIALYYKLIVSVRFIYGMSEDLMKIRILCNG